MRSNVAAFAISSTSRVTKIKAVLKKGTKKVGTGALAKLEGKGTLRLKAAKKLKKGAYVLKLSGTNADGRPGTLTVKVKLK